MKLSLCIATYNEQQNIHYPLDSAYDLADEVIIVDGGSTDQTVQTAKSYGNKVKVFIENNPPMFHINKQKAIERAKGGWILQLDADEALSDELTAEIKEIVHRNNQIPITNFQTNPKSQNPNNKKRNSATPVAFYIPRKNFFLTRFLTKGGQYPDYTIRLYRNGVARFACKTVHENVEIISNIKDQISKIHMKNQKSKTTMKQSTIGYLKNPILHYADPDFSRYLKRWDRYTTLEAQQLVETRHASSLHFINYFFIKPPLTFLSIYIRHKGLLDGFPGFVFALFSSIRFWAIYVKFWQKLLMRRSSHK